jgi:hypothetical protein
MTYFRATIGRSHLFLGDSRQETPLFAMSSLGEFVLYARPCAPLLARPRRLLISTKIPKVLAGEKLAKTVLLQKRTLGEWIRDAINLGGYSIKVQIDRCWDVK